MEPAVDHDPEMNDQILTVLAANFPGIVLNLENEDEDAVIQIEGIEGSNCQPSPPHQVYMSSEEEWVIWDAYMNCVTSYGQGLKSFIENLKTYKYMWASLDLPDFEDENWI